MFKGWNKFRERLSFSSTAFILGITAYFAFVLNISFGALFSEQLKLTVSGL